MIDVLRKELYKFGEVEVLKKGVVFTCLLTGKDLTNWETVNSINSTILSHVGDEFPEIELMRNEKNYFIVVLKKKEKESFEVKGEDGVVISVGDKVRCVKEDKMDDHVGIPKEKRWNIGDEFIVGRIDVEPWGVFLYHSENPDQNINAERVIKIDR